MILLVNQKIISNVLDKLAVTYQIVGETEIKGYCWCITEKGNFYLQKEEAGSATAIKAEIPVLECWKLDKFQNCIGYVRTAVHIQNGELCLGNAEMQDEKAEEVFAYFLRMNRADESLFYSCDEMEACVQKKRQLEYADVYLMIPGKIKKKKGKTVQQIWEEIPSVENDIFQAFSDNISYCIGQEYNNHFLEKLERKCLGPILLEIESDIVEGRNFKQTAIAEIVKYENGLCILEILVHNCYIGGNKLLNYYRGGLLKCVYEGKSYPMETFLEYFSIREYGNKRSVVFAYGDVDEQAIVNALANEEYPMGKIGGVYEKKVKAENIAQYDTAEVYVSSVTMIEYCKKVKDAGLLLVESRIAYHVIEIFFVELLLFQDAAIDKVYVDLEKEQEKQYVSVMSGQDIEQFERISFDMAQAVKFANYEQFRFPTTRESAKRVAKDFGIDFVLEKYETNKELLASMMKANQRKLE